MKSLFERTSVFLLCGASLLFGACTSSTSPAPNGGQSLSGTLLYDIPSASSEVGSYSYSTQRESIIFVGGECPSWTPAGEVLYEEPSDVSPVVDWKIVTRASNGTSKQVLLDSKMFSLNLKKSPKMSKDGKTICINYWVGGSRGPELYTGHSTLLLHPDGKLVLAIDSLFDGSWMPDGSLVLAATVDELYAEQTFFVDGLYKLSSDFTQVTKISNGLVKPKHPAVSPDGKRIAFTMSQHIWVMNADGTGLRQITTSSKEEKHPCWSPDGKNIALMCYGTFETTYFNAIAAVPADNATTIDLSNDSPYWIKDPSQSSNAGLGRITPYSTISWK